MPFPGLYWCFCYLGNSVIDFNGLDPVTETISSRGGSPHLDWVKFWIVGIYSALFFLMM